MCELTKFSKTNTQESFLDLFSDKTNKSNSFTIQILTSTYSMPDTLLDTVDSTLKRPNPSSCGEDRQYIGSK